jgi:hypothetical protein
MTDLKLTQLTAKQLDTLEGNATNQLKSPKGRRQDDARRMLHRVRQKRSARQSNSKLPESAGFRWSRVSNTYTLYYCHKSIGVLKLVANHSQTNRDVYQAELFGKYIRMYEYIDEAKAELIELAKQRLAKEEL